VSWFSIGFSLLFPALLIVVTYLLVRIAYSGRRTYQLIEQTNQKLERVVAELRMLRLRQLGEAPAEPAAEPPQIKVAEPAQVVPRIAPPPPQPEPPTKPAPPRAPPPEVFAPDVKCYYCGHSQPVARYLSQPICTTCQKNALLKDEPAAG